MIEQLWKEYDEKRTPEARERLIMACLPYIKACAHRLAIYATHCQDVDDLIGAGIIGLMDALKRYDPAKSASFKYYAKYRIGGSIIDEIRSMRWVPYSIRDKARAIEVVMRKLEQNRGKPPEEEEVAKAMGLSLDKYHKVLLEINRMTFLVFKGGLYNGDMSNISVDALARNPESELLLAEMETMLCNAIERLSEKERHVVTLYYYEEMTMKEIGKVLDVSESRVCQIHSSAIIRLHKWLKYLDADIHA